MRRSVIFSTGVALGLALGVFVACCRPTCARPRDPATTLPDLGGEATLTLSYPTEAGQRDMVFRVAGVEGGRDAPRGGWLLVRAGEGEGHQVILLRPVRHTALPPDALTQ